MNRTPIISLGAGVQSSALLLMADAGELDALPYGRPELAIFADTHRENRPVYPWLDYLEEQASSIEVARVSAGDLLEIATGRDFNPIPLYIRQADGTAGIGRRQCTKEFKLYPIRHELRRRGLDPVDVMLGITTNETERAKDSGLKWARNVYPLLDLEMSRQDCRRWLLEHGHPDPPRSACTFCPYRTAHEWAQMRRDDPESWAEAIAADEAMRESPAGEQYVLSSLTPLRDLETAEDRGQLTLTEADECEGGCFL